MKILSLGSSFAAGPGIPPLASRQAMRSTLNYPSLLASRLGASLTDLSVSGATLLNLLDIPQGMFGSFPPQVEEVPSDADLVTITAGGNDLGYIGGIMRDSMSASTFGAWVTWAMMPAPNAAVVPTEDEVVERYRKVIHAVRARAPNARILLVEYLALLGPDIKPGINVPLSEAQVKRHREVERTLRRVYARAAEGMDRCEVMSIAERSEAHGVGSPEPWVAGHGWGMITGGEAAWHPNKRGMEIVADILYDKLKEDTVDRK